MATSPLLEYFDNPDTRRTVTGATWGSEIETHFVDDAGRPISVDTTRKLLDATPPQPWSTTIDLGNQLIELVVGPQPSAEALLRSTLEGLGWLYEVAERLGAYPLFAPALQWPHGDLLWIQDARDQMWCELDGQVPLEYLCRIAAVQVTVSVHPSELVPTINALWEAGLHHRDYALNDAAWRSYIAESTASYRTERYAGPAGFENLEAYVDYLNRQKVVMFQGQACSLNIGDMPKLTRGELDLFIRSSWPHYRARVFDGPDCSRVSAVEMRPFSRRTDADIALVIRQIGQVLGL